MQLFFAKKFRKMYSKLPKKIQKRCDERLLLFTTSPFHPLLENHPLHGEYAGCRSINITGDYRAIFYHQDNTTAWFIAVDTHHNLYGK